MAISKNEAINAGINMGLGGGLGVADQLLQNQDEKRRRDAEAAGQQFPWYKQFGTYLNFAAPAAAVVAAGFGVIKGTVADKAILAGAQLAGRKAAYKASKATQALPWRPYEPPNNGAPPPPPPPSHMGSTLEF